MRAAPTLFWLIVLAGPASAEEDAALVAHRAQLKSALQDKFKFSLSGQAPPSSTAPIGADVVPMKPYEVKVSRDLVTKLAPNQPTRRFDVTKDIKIISKDIGKAHLDVGLMQYIPIIPGTGLGLPKITIINIRW